MGPARLLRDLSGQIRLQSAEAWPASMRLLTVISPCSVRSRALLAFLLVVCAAILLEARTSAVQSWLLSSYAARLSYTIGAGPSGRVVFPEGGPFDVSRGYSLLPEFLRRLQARGFRVKEQALIAPAMARLARWGIPLPYSEPPLVGLVLRDARGKPLYDARARLGDGQLREFDDIPPLILNALLFIENRELAESAGPRANPAVDWKRFAKAGLLYTGSRLGLSVRMEGGSTLATQLEKYRHSPGGRTPSPADKLRQMMAASLKAYQGGPDTRAGRREIILEYLNSMPLSARPGLGEIHGLGDGMRVWFGTNLEDACAVLRSRDSGDQAKARAFKQVLALLYAVHAPSYYLVWNRPALEAKVASYASLLREAGVLDAAVCRRMLEAPLEFNDGQATPTGSPPRTFDAQRKSAETLRADLSELLGVRGPYELDHLDLDVGTTIDAGLQQEVTRLFRDLKDPAFLEVSGLRGERLLGKGDPGRVVYSFVLFERTLAGDLLRVRSDSLDRPFDVNDGMKMELGSTAKLRLLAHYLDIVAQLHGEMARLDEDELDRRAAVARDPITRWAAETLRSARGLSLRPFLQRALDRTYSASPAEVFFTGGGAHVFVNFDPRDDVRIMSIRQGTVHSTNLIFIRLMRDLVRYHEARLPYDTRAVLAQEDHPERRRLLEEIADEEAKTSLSRAYREYRQLGSRAIVRRLAGAGAASPRRLALVFHAWHPGADAAALSRWLVRHDVVVSTEELGRLAVTYGNPRLTLEDFGFLLRKQPLDIWCAGEIANDPGIAWDDLLARSGEARRMASRWLFRSRSRNAQDTRLRIRFERDAFNRMTPAWRQLGFPFERLVPSLATAIGSSADRPAALADLMGLILNDGERRPPVFIRSLRFAAGTPYHTLFEPAPRDGTRVLPAAVAGVLKDVLADVVERGTAQRVKDIFTGPEGGPIAVGGKTGSGDNRYESFASGGKVVSSRAVSRTAAFAFYIGDRYYGVIAALVSGADADKFTFTSALPLALLRLLAPAINERLAQVPDVGPADAHATDQAGRPGSRPSNPPWRRSLAL